MNKITEKIFSDFKTRERSISFFGQNQYVDWKYIITTLFIILFVAIGFSWFAFYDLTDEIDIFASNPVAANTGTINKDVLDRTISRMEDRQKKFDDLKKSRPIVSDPSV